MKSSRKIILFAILMLALFILAAFLYLQWRHGFFIKSASVEITEIPTTTPGLVTNPVAFPGAEGFGSNTVGGRGGQVITVTNLNDAGPGSLRSAIETEGPRIIVFRTAGTIELKSSISIMNPFVTIAGQTAPGGGITLKSSPSNGEGTLVIATHDVIIRYIRSRPGPPTISSSNGDALEILGPDAYNVIIDHCSLSWAIDEVASTWYDAHDITIQWSIISEGLNCSTHTKGCHSMGLLLGSEGSRNISIHHNLLAHNMQRNPLIQTSGVVDVVNNLIFDTVYTPITINDGYGEVAVNIIKNYYQQTSGHAEYLISADSENGPGLKIYLNGNISPTRPEDDQNQGLVMKRTVPGWLVSSWISAPIITTFDAKSLFDEILPDAGATIGLDEFGKAFSRRDVVDERVVNDVQNGVARIVNDPSEVGGWPILDSGTVVLDTDKDGMPDEWEIKYGFDSNNPADGALDKDGDGYTNIEEYLNQTNPLQTIG